MWLLGIEEVMFFNLRDVVFLVLGISDESWKRAEGYNVVWIELKGLGEIDKELLDTPGLPLKHHHRQTLRTIDSLARH